MQFEDEAIMMVNKVIDQPIPSPCDGCSLLLVLDHFMTASQTNPVAVVV